MTSTNWANLDKIRDFPNASDKTYKEALDALKKYRDSEEATNFTQRIDQWFESTKTLIGNATQKIEHQEKDKSLAYLSPTAKHLFDIHVGSVIRDTKKISSKVINSKK
ncbi:MAG UNVERIFIED_CONTAM: hypothetical protein LVQ98_02345 [Rickettsiaceae bacterium]